MSKTTTYDTIERKYYRMGAVAEMLNVPASKIRFWMREFDLDVKTGRNGDRYFTDADIDQLRKIYRLLKVDGYTIRGAQRHFDHRFDQQIETMLRPG